jgi:membrane protein
MLSLVPLLSLSLALASLAGLTTEVETLSNQLLPPEAHAIVQDQVKKIEEDRPVGLLSLSALLLLWSASSLFVAVMESTNAAYEVHEARPWWKKRLVATVLTLVEAVLLVGASASIAAWPEVASWLRLGGAARTLATAVHWLVVIVSLMTVFALAYYFGPNIEQEWEWITPGSALGVLALILASLGFRLYLLYGPAYSETYGALAGVVLMLLWQYLAALTLLVGAELNCVIEHAAPHGRAPGQKEAPGS